MFFGGRARKDLVREDAEHRPLSARREPGIVRWLIRLAWVPVPVFLLVLIALRVLNSQVTHESPYLLAILYFVFSTLTSLLIAYLLGRSFLIRSDPGLLMLGCGAAVWGMAGVAATIAGLTGSAWQDFSNTIITIHNSSIWLSAVCQLTGVVLSLRLRKPVRDSGLWLAIAYALAVSTVVIVALSSLAGWTPTFFVHGQGGTPLRQVMLGSSVIMFALAAALLGQMNHRSPSPFAYWYSLAMALIAIGLFGFMVESEAGDVVCWLSRGLQFLSGVYMLVAAIASVHESRVWGNPLETALRESEERYRSLFNAMTEGFAIHEIICDSKGVPCDYRFLDINPAFERLTGIKREDVVGKAKTDVLGLANDDSYWVEMYGRVALTGEPVQFEQYSIPLKRHYEVYAYRTAPRQFAVIFMDITTRKEAEAAAMEGKRILDALMEWVPEGITIADAPDARIRMVSRYGQEMLGSHAGMTAEQVTAHWKVYHKDGVSPMADEDLPLLRAMLRGETVQDEELVQVDSNGRRLMLLCNAAPIHNPDGTITGAVVAWRDIAERKRAEEALREANEQLQEADRRKDEFLAMLAHELRNPLSPVRIAVEIMRLAAPKDPVLMRQREVIERQVSHMARLLDDLLDVSRITRGKIELKMQPLQLTDVLLHAVETATPLIEARQHLLSVSQPPGPLCVEGDPHRLAQAIGNLLVNAAKFTEERGHIWLSSAHEGDEVVIRVQDTGAGIAPDMLPRVFDLFTQADRTLGRSKGGLGIGLTMVKNLVEMHGGKVEARSEGLGRGSEFVIRLPAMPCDAAQPVEAVEPEMPESQAPRCRILVVDDIVDSADSLAQMLHLCGYDVRAVYSGSEALNVARDYHPGVVLLDIGMPVMDGYEVARRLRAEHGSKMVLVAVTGYAQAADRETSREAGFDHHLPKPVDLDALRELLTRADAR